MERKSIKKKSIKKINAETKKKWLEENTNLIMLNEKAEQAMRVPVMSKERVNSCIPHLNAREAKAWTPATQDKLNVKLLVAAGKTMEEIARIIHPSGKPVSINTLRRKFREELMDGKNQLQLEMLQRSYDYAMSNLQGHGAMKMFLLKSLFGLREQGGVAKVAEDTKAVADHMQETALAMAATMPSAPKPKEEEEEVVEASA